MNDRRDGPEGMSRFGAFSALPTATVLAVVVAAVAAAVLVVVL